MFRHQDVPDYWTGDSIRQFLHLVVTVENYGKTPATLERVTAGVIPYAERLRAPNFDNVQTFRVNMNLPPLANLETPITVQLDKLHSVPNPLIFARFHYSDIFRRSRFSGFILQIKLDAFSTGAIDAHPQYTNWT